MVKILGQVEIFSKKGSMQLLNEQIIIWVPKLFVAIAVFSGFYLIAKAGKAVVLKVGAKGRLPQAIVSLLGRTLSIVLIIIGGITALGTLGIDVTALVAGLGLTGFALGFALKDTISNLLAGILLLAYRPFEIDDHINLSGHVGRVVSIDLRYTTLINEDKKILIPNSLIFTNTVTLLDKGSSN